MSFAMPMKGQTVEWPLGKPQWKSKGSRSLVTWKCKEEGDIKVDLTELRVKGCKPVSSSLWQNRGEGLVKKVNHIRLPLIGGNFFTNSATLRCVSYARMATWIKGYRIVLLFTLSYLFSFATIPRM
jgi:hypothetical protein